MPSGLSHFNTFTQELPGDELFLKPIKLGCNLTDCRHCTQTEGQDRSWHCWCLVLLHGSRTCCHDNGKTLWPALQHLLPWQPLACPNCHPEKKIIKYMLDSFNKHHHYDTVLNKLNIHTYPSREKLRSQLWSFDLINMSDGSTGFNQKCSYVNKEFMDSENKNRIKV